MPLELDHVIIAVADLDTAIQDYQALGFTTVRGGVHMNRASQNALITFQDGTYLELLAPTGEQPVPGLIDFSTLLQHGEGLVGFALRSDDLDEEVVRLQADGFAVGDVTMGERHRGDGTLIQWKLALLDNGFAPFLIQDVTPRTWRIPNDPNLTSHLNRAVGLRGLELVVRDLTTSLDRYARLFGIWGLSQAAPHALKNVILHETKTEQAETLHAVHLILLQRGNTLFALEKTHGVHFELVYSVD